MKLEDKQSAVLEKIAGQSGMDCWLFIDKNNNVHDRENHNRFMSPKEAVKLIAEGMTCYKDYRLTRAEIKVFKDLVSMANH